MQVERPDAAALAALLANYWAFWPSTGFTGSSGQDLMHLARNGLNGPAEGSSGP